MYRRWVGVPIASALALQGGCYRYVPTATASPAIGNRYAFTITDQGRVALSERLGAGVTKVDGTLVRRDGEAYVLSVNDVESIASGPTSWNGELIPVQPSYIQSISERQFSRGRTAVAIGATAAAIAAFIVTRSLVGTGSGPSTGTGGPGGGT